MNQSLRRQRRLLAVRSLQADYAAAELRRSQIEAAEASAHLQQARALARPDVAHLLSQAHDPEMWVLSCAEQELAGMEVDQRTTALSELDARTAALGQHEREARRDREQIGSICERLKLEADYAEQIGQQSSLDDLFSASLLRRRLSC